MCLMYTVTSGIQERSGSVAWFIFLPPLHTILSKGEKRTNKQRKTNKIWVLGRGGKFWILSSACCQGNPALLSFSSCLSDCLWKEVTLGICYCMGDDLSQLFLYIYIYYSIPNVTFFFCRLWQGLRSSQGGKSLKSTLIQLLTSIKSMERQNVNFFFRNTSSFSTCNKWEGSLKSWLLLTLCCCANWT